MRKDALQYNRPEIHRISCYHSGHFQNLKVYNSDRTANLNSDYTISENNTESIKSIMKVGTRLAYIGLELEVVSDLESIDPERTVLTNVLKMVFEKSGFDKDFFKTETDCTVSAENITQTFTRSWMRNNYKCWKAMYECFKELKITTNSERCGMHVNLDLMNFGSIESDQIENVRKLGYLINKHYDLMKIAFNRTGSTRWCPRMNATKDYWKNTSLYDFPISHDECCINMGHIHQKRVEIRLVGGQKDFGCFRNTMETVFHLIDRVKKLSWNDLDDLSKVFSGCNDKVYDRLSTNCLRAGTIDNVTLEKIRPTVNPYKGL
jgi:hypothetical protein